jgi:hypothetical protein
MDFESPEALLLLACLKTSIPRHSWDEAEACGHSQELQLPQSQIRASAVIWPPILRPPSVAAAEQPPPVSCRRQAAAVVVEG